MALMRLVHSHGFGPELLASFANGRIESFIPSRALEPQEMADMGYAPRIAANLARFHAIPGPGMPAAGTQPRTPFARIAKWLDTAEEFSFDDPAKQAAFDTFDFKRLKGEFVALQAAAGATRSPTVFAHNDLLSGNILVPLDNSGAANGMTFIDFEYADWAPRGFDLGNHFVEYGGNDNDYSKFPSQEQAERFCRAYLTASSGSEPSDAAVAALVAEANLFALASLQYWGSWGLLQAKWSAIDFDFLSYSQGRWAEYFKRKDAFMGAAAAVFGSGDSQ